MPDTFRDDNELLVVLKQTPIDILSQLKEALAKAKTNEDLQHLSQDTRFAPFRRWLTDMGAACGVLSLLLGGYIHFADNKKQPTSQELINHVNEIMIQTIHIEGDVHGDISQEQTFRSVTSKVGRNDPCPCRSGKKYKHCCGKLGPVK